jgi:hypothetical protein
MLCILPILAAVLCIGTSAVAATPVIIKDVMVVLLKPEAKGRDGLYWQSVPRLSCLELLATFRKAIKEDVPMNLGMETARTYQPDLKGPLISVAGRVASLAYTTTAK